MMKSINIIFSDRPLLDLSFSVFRAFFSDRPEIKNYCSPSGKCRARNAEEQRACVYFSKPLLWIGCTMLSRSERCLHDQATHSARR